MYHARPNIRQVVGLYVCMIVKWFTWLGDNCDAWGQFSYLQPSKPYLKPLLVLYQPTASFLRDNAYESWALWVTISVCVCVCGGFIMWNFHIELISWQLFIIIIANILILHIAYILTDDIISPTQIRMNAQLYAVASCDHEINYILYIWILAVYSR